MIGRVRAYSMVPEFGLIDLARQVRTVLAENVPGNFVECGTWRGGASFLMAELLRQAKVQDRKVWLCDSFEGHRAPDAIDGPAALAYTRNTDDPEYRDNCRADIADVQHSAQLLGLESYTELVKGWFDTTLPALRERIGPIALLRIDCDWHASVRCCLDNLYDQVAEGGFVLFDDYFSYDGCAVAAHEFLGERRLAHRLHTESGVAFFRKL
jgi:O-methyltransferase